MSTERITNLPEHRFGESETDRLVDKWTTRFQKPSGSWTLRRSQAQMLEYIADDSLPGAVGALGVGTGKTLIAQLAGEAAGAETPLILAPAELRDEGRIERETYLDHFEVPEPNYLSYTKLGHQDYVDVLDRIEPDLIVADEAHYLANPSSGRTGRLAEYLTSNPSTTFVPMSGTITRSSIFDFRHIVIHALRDGAPVPGQYSTARLWSRALDADPHAPPNGRVWAEIGKLVDDEDADLTRQTARHAFRERFASTPGVVVDLSASSDKPIVFREVAPSSVPDEIDKAIEFARKWWELPGGEEIVDALRRSAKVKQLVQGFYYRVAWGEDGPNRDWLDVRRRFHSRVRKYAKRADPGRDTFGLVVDALERGEIHFDVYDEWTEWEDFEPPERECVWMSDYLIEDAVERAEPGTIIWYKHRAVGERLADYVPTAMAGEDPPRDADVCALSIHSHSTGLNLQHDFHRNLILSPPSNGGAWEQLIGRTHRPGQDADEVVVEWYGHYEEHKTALDSACEDAIYMADNAGMEHRLLELVR